MPRRSWLAYLMVVLAGCAGASHRPPNMPTGSGHGGADVRWPALPIPQVLGMPSCKELKSTPELLWFAQNSLRQARSRLVEVGADGVPLLFSADPAWLATRMQLASNIAPLLCETIQQDTSSATYLLVPLIGDWLPEMRMEEAERLRRLRAPVDEMQLWPGAEGGPLLTPVADDDLRLRGQQSRAAPLHLDPVGAGSLLRLTPPTFGPRLGVFWQQEHKGPAQPNQLSTTILEDPLDYRFRLPSGTVRVLIIKF